MTNRSGLEQIQANPFNFGTEPNFAWHIFKDVLCVDQKCYEKKASLVLGTHKTI